MKQRLQVPNQLSLFEPVEIKPPEIKDNRTLEERAVSERLQGINHLVDYGVTFNELASFQSKPSEEARARNYEAIKKAFYGINNIESLDGRFGVPHEMLAMMKPFEIIGLYIGIAHAKMSGMEYDSIVTLLPNQFEKAINELVNIAYKYHGIKVMKKKKSNQIKATSLKERMQLIPESQRRKFLLSFMIPYRKPGSATRYLPYEFRDPHPENKPDYTGIDIYRRQFSDFMHRIFERNLRAMK